MRLQWVCCGAGLALAAGLCVHAQEYTFTTIAGNAGYGSSDGPGSAARFLQPVGIAVAANGQLLVTDAYNSTVRKLTLTGSEWVVSTLAGRAGSPGSDNGTNGAARFDFPFAVAAAANGRLFVTDVNNATIRQLTLSGTNWVVSTIAGSVGNSGNADGTNTVARFNGPLGAAADGSGNLLVADANSHTIRKLTLTGTNWAVTTLAGQVDTPGSDDGTNRTALFNSPIGMAVDSSGNAYIADNGSHTIRKLTFVGTNRVVRTIAGRAGFAGSSDGTNDVARFNGPAGVAVDASGNVYVAEWGNSVIRRLSPLGTNWVVSTIAGWIGGSADGTNRTAQFFQPYGIAVDTNGFVYVADAGNNTIRKLTPQGTNWVVTTIAGLAGGQGSADGTNIAARFSAPYPGAVDPAGNVYVADSENSTLRKITRVGTDWVTQTIAGFPHANGSADGTNGVAKFFYPYAVAADPSGNLYVADTFNSLIRKVTPLGPDWVVTTIAGLASDFSSADGTNLDTRVNAPFALAADASGSVFVADTGNNTIRKITPAGTNWIVTTLAGLAGPGNSGSANGTNSVARFKGPQGLVVGNGSAVFVADTDNNTIRKLTPTGTNWVVTTIAGLAGAAAATDGTNSVARFNGPASLALDAGGNLLVADRGNATIRKLTPVGTNWVVTTIGGAAGIYGNADGRGTNALFSAPGGLAVDGAGRIFVGDNNSIRLGQLLTPAVAGPELRIALAGKQVILSWPASGGSYSLETTNALPGGPAWTVLNGAALSGTNFVLTNPISGGAGFFRLHQR